MMQGSLLGSQNAATGLIRQDSSGTSTNQETYMTPEKPFSKKHMYRIFRNVHWDVVDTFSNHSTKTGE